MRQVRSAESWVVYERTAKGQPTGVNVVCEQAEWAALDRDEPGVHTLIKAGITNEGEAERLARDRTVPATGKKAARL
jgi:hypothetical protein